MRLRNWALDRLRPFFREHPKLKSWSLEADKQLDVWRHWAAQYVPAIIQPDISGLKISITAQCNLRCLGCRYGRDYMPNQQLPFSVVRQLLNDAKALGIPAVNFYGGEPLIHPDLPRMVAHATQLGMQTSLTTNAILLREKVDALYEAGLRKIGIGSYGIGQDYNAYVQRKESFHRVETGIAYIRECFGTTMDLCLYWLLMRPTCNLQSLHDVWQFATRYSTPMELCLIHYSFPYFTEGPEHKLQFSSEDRPAIERVVAELIRLKSTRPELVRNSLMGLRSVPDWLVKKADMRIPCTIYRKLWVAADGGVYVCQGTSPLGNLYEKRLLHIASSSVHRQTARACFSLNCAKCHTDWDGRIQGNASSRKLYAQQQFFERFKETPH